MEKSYKKLLAWRKADEFCRNVYLITQQFPKTEIYGLTSQLRRAAVSVPTNLVEGAARRNTNEFKQFINIAIGSLAETEYLLELSQALGYVSKKEYDLIEPLRRESGALLYGLYKSFS